MLRNVSVVAIVVISLGSGCWAQTTSAPAADALVAKLSAQHSGWLRAPGNSLQSLAYNYHLGNDDRRVELVKGVSGGGRALWHGTTLTTGLHWLLAGPDRFDVEVQEIDETGDDSPSHWRLVATLKDAGENLSIVAGNGISGSWRGYFSHGAKSVTIDLDSRTGLPISEVAGRTRFEYHQWEETGSGRWVPLRIDIVSGRQHYRMHFGWHQQAVWLLTHAESITTDKTERIAWVSDVKVNDQHVIADATTAQAEQKRNRDLLQTMIDHNLRWLQPEPMFETLEYRFHMPWPNVTETCIVQREGPAVFELSQDGYGKKASALGDWKAVLANGTYASANRADRWAAPQQLKRRRNRPLYSEQLRRYALTGCQFDLPLFELPRVLSQTRLDVADGQWEGTPCHVVTMNVPGSYLGCGTMLGFTSWSYVHHLYPAYEVLYIDKRRNVPIHETFVSRRDDRRFEIDFKRYVEIEAGQWVPLRIDLVSDGYFSCRYDFQLIEKQQWLLKKAKSWFDPRERIRGVIRDVKVDQPTPLTKTVVKTVRDYEELFRSDPAGGSTLEIPTLKFELGKKTSLGLVELVFTLDPAGELILVCTADEAAIPLDQRMSVILLDDQNRLVQAANTQFSLESGRMTASLHFGSSAALANVRRYAVAGFALADGSRSEPATLLRVRRPASTEKSERPRPLVADDSGKTRVIDVTLNRNEAGNTAAVVRFASDDRMNGFELDVSVAAFDTQGQLLATAAKSGQLIVRARIAEETWELPLPEDVDLDAVAHVLVGISRGRTFTAPMGSTWGTYLTQYPIYSIEELLAADHPGCWRTGLQELDRRLREETLRRGLLDGPRDWKDQVAENKTHTDKLQPYVDRLLQIVAAAEQPTVLSAAARLLGFAGDPRAVEVLSALLHHQNESVRNDVAISLGLLGNDAGISQIEAAILASEPLGGSNRKAWRNQTDAMIAAVSIRNEASIELVRKCMLQAIDHIAVVIHDEGGKSVPGGHIPETLARLTGCLTDPRYAPLLIEVIERIEGDERLNEVYSTDEYATSLFEYPDESREFVEQRIRLGDGEYLANPRPEYVPAVRQMLERDDLAIWSIHAAVRYLWDTGTPEAQETLSQLYERPLPSVPERDLVRLYLLEALAHYGDHRGFPESFATLVALAEPGDAPSNSRERRKWRRALEKKREYALDVFGRAQTAAVVEFIANQADSTEGPVRLAALQVLGELRRLPDSLTPIVRAWSTDEGNDAVAINARKLLSRLR